MDKLLFAVGFMVCILFLIKMKNRIQINRWQKSLNLKQHSRVFNELYQNVDGFSLSRESRRTQDALEYVYGEIEFIPFIALLSLARPNKDTVFYDLGSGTGKAVIACALVFPVKRSVGIELFPQLVASACNQRNKLLEMPRYRDIAATIDFIEGDYFTTNFAAATMVFANSTALFGETWNNFCQKIDASPNLQTVITTSKPLVSAAFTMVLSTKIAMSWGVVRAFIHTRKTNLH